MIAHKLERVNNCDCNRSWNPQGLIILFLLWNNFTFRWMCTTCKRRRKQGTWEMEELKHNRIQYSVLSIKTKMNNPEPRGNISLQQAVLLMELKKLLNKRHPHDKLQVNHKPRTVWFINWRHFYSVFQAIGFSEILFWNVLEWIVQILACWAAIKSRTLMFMNTGWSLQQSRNNRRSLFIALFIKMEWDDLTFQKSSQGIHSPFSHGQTYSFHSAPSFFEN